MKEEGVMEGTNGLKESESLVVGFGRFVVEKAVNGSISCLFASANTVVLPLSAGRIRMWELDLRERTAWRSSGV